MKTTKRKSGFYRMAIISSLFGFAAHEGIKLLDPTVTIQLWQNLLVFNLIGLMIYVLGHRRHFGHDWNHRHAE